MPLKVYELILGMVFEKQLQLKIHWFIRNINFKTESSLLFRLRIFSLTIQVLSVNSYEHENYGQVLYPIRLSVRENSLESLEQQTESFEKFKQTNPMLHGFNQCFKYKVSSFKSFKVLTNV